VKNQLFSVPGAYMNFNRQLLLSIALLPCASFAMESTQPLTFEDVNSAHQKLHRNQLLLEYNKPADIIFNALRNQIVGNSAAPMMTPAMAPIKKTTFDLSEWHFFNAERRLPLYQTMPLSNNEKMTCFALENRASRQKHTPFRRSATFNNVPVNPQPETIQPENIIVPEEIQPTTEQTISEEITNESSDAAQLIARHTQRHTANDNFYEQNNLNPNTLSRAEFQQIIGRGSFPYSELQTAEQPANLPFYKRWFNKVCGAFSFPKAVLAPLNGRPANVRQYALAQLRKIQEFVKKADAVAKRQKIIATTLTATSAAVATFLRNKQLNMLPRLSKAIGLGALAGACGYGLTLLTHLYIKKEKLRTPVIQALSNINSTLSPQDQIATLNAFDNNQEFSSLHAKNHWLNSGLLPRCGIIEPNHFSRQILDEPSLGGAEPFYATEHATANVNDRDAEILFYSNGRGELAQRYTNAYNSVPGDQY